ncbi:hypothetical protein [Novosphingobium mangrovi (ex Hu et al. 2023)]|uniref:Secreted protein n=1 Tax=Novosphingobium mangrovi (ex Hu et al. 2023) TaxID=2930094 RepID=A0ABT0AAP2_9SPHN|nr:hypothetical protein [Novosphingobium mangrovi (ex Hu et al. 2023)]MCJ1960260.1 hypothetical protein [Novosphingobium mangrovi (ex Hu et al. 2023)]MED5544962.1 hypothetical protein [Pseudomonadota bacterium]
MMFLGPRLTRVFRSRWHALFWAASVLLTAYCTVPASEDGGRDKPEAVAKTHGKHKNPWATETPTSPD